MPDAPHTRRWIFSPGKALKRARRASAPASIQGLADRHAYFWATHGGAELDLLLAKGGRRLGFEFKCSEAPVATKSMHIARQDLELDRGLGLLPRPDALLAGERHRVLPPRTGAGIAASSALRELSAALIVARIGTFMAGAFGGDGRRRSAGPRTRLF